MSVIGSMSFDDIDEVIKRDDRGGHETVAGLEFSDIAEQDVTEPVWPSEPLDYGKQAQRGHSGHSHGGVRTASGLIDLMTEVRDEVHEWIERESDGPGHRPHRTRDKPMMVHVLPHAAKSGRANTYDVGKESPNVGNATKILTQRSDRIRAIVTNYGPGILYLAFRTDATGLNPEPNMMQIPDPATAKTGQSCSREIRVQAELWAYPNTVGTSQIIDVQDEYGIPDDAGA